jgi:acyl-CoA thioesterase
MITAMKSAREIISIMLNSDTFSKWLRIDVIQIEKGSCELQMETNDEMLNGFKILHGGISYSLADSALAFASNSYGYKCVSIETSISHIRPVRKGDVLTARASEIHRGKTTGIYDVLLTNQENKKVAVFKGIIHISKEIW